MIPVLVEVARHLDESAVLFEEVVEVQGALLPVFESWRQQREHGLAEDPCLDLRAGVEPDHGRAVMQRVVERLIGIEHP